jgi:hypothetical protein
LNLPNEEGKPCCGPECSPISCLTLFLDLLAGLQPAVEFEANATKAATVATRDTKAIEHEEDLAGKEEETELCCGQGCGQKTCLAYLAGLLKELELPVNKRKCTELTGMSSGRNCFHSISCADDEAL